MGMSMRHKYEGHLTNALLNAQIFLSPCARCGVKDEQTIENDYKYSLFCS
jgi:hypothetical protein